MVNNQSFLHYNHMFRFLLQVSIGILTLLRGLERNVNANPIHGGKGHLHCFPRIVFVMNRVVIFKNRD